MGHLPFANRYHRDVSSYIRLPNSLACDCMAMVLVLNCMSLMALWAVLAARNSESELAIKDECQLKAKTKGKICSMIGFGWQIK